MGKNNLFMPRDEYDKAIEILKTKPAEGDVEAMFERAYAKEVKYAEDAKRDKFEEMISSYNEFASKFNVLDNNYRQAYDMVAGFAKSLGFWSLEGNHTFNDFKKINGEAREATFEFKFEPKLIQTERNHPNLVNSFKVSTNFCISHSYFGCYIHDQGKRDASGNPLPDEAKIREEIKEFPFDGFQKEYNKYLPVMKKFRDSTTELEITYRDLQHARCKLSIPNKDICSDELIKIVKSIYVDIFNEDQIDFDRFDKILRGKL